MKRNLYLPFALVALLFAAQCNNNSTPVAVNWNDDPKEELNEKTVTMEGYVFLSYTGGYVKLKPRKNAGEIVSRQINIVTGDGNNQKKGIPNQYSESSLQFKTDKGEAGVSGDYIRVTGVYAYDKYANEFRINDVSKIEKVPAPTDDYSKLGAAELTPTNLAAMNKKLAVIEGTLSLPDSFVTEYGAVVFIFTNDKFTAPITLQTSFSDNPYPNSTLTLAPGAAPTDVVLHDKDRKPVDLTKKVRLYGTWFSREVLSVNEKYFKTEQVEQAP